MQMQKSTNSISSRPLISVITVTRNAAQYIQKTAQSILCQENSFFEFLLIDGNSSDRTVEIVQTMVKDNPPLGVSFKSISEPDKGVYDAMNKGVSLATGEFVLFMNGGDIFYSPQVLSQFETAIKANPNVDVFYGDTMMCFYEGKGVYNEEAGKIRNPVMPFIHQSAIARRSLLTEHPFDLSYSIIADYVFFKKLRDTGRKFLHVDFIVSEYDAKVGLSENNPLIIKYEQDRVNGLSTRKCYWVRKLLLRCTVGLIQPIKDICPSFIWNLYARRKKKYIIWQK